MFTFQSTYNQDWDTLQHQNGGKKLKVCPICLVMILILGSFLCAHGKSAPTMPRIIVDDDKTQFVRGLDKTPFLPWGFNYLGRSGHLAEDDWTTPAGWQQIEEDFQAMRSLGANVVRWHLQFATYMNSAEQVNENQLQRLRGLLALARRQRLYLDLTGMGCYRLEQIPSWYDELSEPERWQAQAVFWEAIAKTCGRDSVVFCYDLMNEPIITKPKKDEHPWVGGELGGFHFVQRVSKQPGVEPTQETAENWVKTLVSAIRKHDQKTLVTVGVIPWAFVWSSAKPLFYAPNVARHLDFASIHVYPKAADTLEQELKALAVYQVGMPLVIEETFPLSCSLPEFKSFVEAAESQVNGWISHYFGYTPAEHRAGKGQPNVGEQIADFLEYWADKGLQQQQKAATKDAPPAPQNVP